jgi:DNA-binding PadR family transcriptional regulator
MAVLALLEEEPRHGYELKTEFESRTGGYWPLNVGQVYTTLDRLEQAGLVAPLATARAKAAAKKGRNQRAYAITAAGRKELRRWLEVDAPPELPRDELLVKVLVLVGRDTRAALEVITSQRAALYGRLQAHRRNQPDGDLPARLLHDAVAGRTEADLRWLDLCEERLRPGKRTAGGKT